MRSYQFGSFHIDVEQRALLRDGSPVRLTQRVFELLLVLVQNSGRIVTKETLLREVWAGSFVEENNLTVSISALRKALGDEHNHLFIETVSKRGYRFVAPVRVEDKTEGGNYAEKDSESYFNLKPRARSSLSPIAVLPFVNLTGTRAAEYLCEAIAESLINKLTDDLRLRVIARSTSFLYREAGIDPVEAGRQLKVRAVLTGRILEFEGHLIIRAELIDVARKVQLWGGQYDCPPSDVFAVQKNISWQIINSLRLSLPKEQRQAFSKRHTENPEAYHDYLKACHYWNKRTAQNIERAVGYFKRAIEADPHYALAFAGLADCYNLQSSFGVRPPRQSFRDAKVAATTALAIDDSLAEAHTSLALLKTLYEWDWKGARQSYLRAIALNPGYATAHHWYGNYLGRMGADDEALRHIKVAESLDPLSPLIKVSMAWIYCAARNYDRALEYCWAALDLDASFAPAQATRALCYLYQGLHEQSIAEIENLSKSVEDTELFAFLGHLYGIAGEPRKAEMMLESLKEKMSTMYISPYYLALVHSGLGNKGEAFSYLEDALREHYPQLTHLKAQPTFDSLREDSRYADLLRNMRLIR